MDVTMVYLLSLEDHRGEYNSYVLPIDVNCQFNVTSTTPLGEIPQPYTESVSRLGVIEIKWSQPMKMFNYSES